MRAESRGRIPSLALLATLLLNLSCGITVEGFEHYCILGQIQCDGNGRFAGPREGT